jgi:hypothetical protein
MNPYSSGAKKISSLGFCSRSGCIVFMISFLVFIASLCLAAAVLRAPIMATVIWVLVLETSPDDWLARLVGGHETIVGVLKAAGLALALVMVLRFGAKMDRWNPGFAFVWMFGAGLVHGLFPGLGLLDSIRSLAGSAAPFAFGFVKLPARWCRAVITAVMWGPVFTVAFGLALNIGGLHAMYDVEQGALRLGASGEPPFLAGFTLVAIYAGLLEVSAPAAAGHGIWALLAANFVILVLTGARAPLLLAVLLGLGVLLAQRRLFLLAGAGVLASLGVMLAGQLRFVRVIDLAQLGEAGSLSNRDLVWPFFERAFWSSPWVGWGVGAGKVVVPVSSSLNHLIGTNAAHDEYLRIGAEGGVLGIALLVGLLAAWVARGSRAMPPGQRWLMRAIFIAFAIHSATDNTLIATTSSVFFIWVCAAFATAPEAVKAVA